MVTLALVGELLAIVLYCVVIYAWVVVPLYDANVAPTQ
jgi:cytochrome c oxidase assembly factor CtaG